MPTPTPRAPVTESPLPPLARRPLAGVFLLALAMRLVWLATLLAEAPELMAHPPVDGAFYHQWALDILAGTGLSQQAFFAHPLYPHVIAGLYAIFHPDPLVVALFQIVLGAGSAVVMTLWCHRLRMGSAAWIAGVGWALLWPAVANAALLETVELGNFLLLLALLAWARRGLPARLLSGVAFAGAVLCRGNLLLLAPAFVFLDSVASTRAVRLRRAAAFLCGLALVLGAVGARNRIVAGTWLFVSGHAGVTLYSGFAPGNFTGTYQAPTFVRPEPRYEQEDFHTEAERRVGRRLSVAAASRYWRDRALAAIAADPAGAMIRLVNKFGLVLASYEGADNYNLNYLRRITWFRYVPLPDYGLLMTLACVGMPLAWRHRQHLSIAYAAVLLYVATLLLFFVSSRLRAPLWVVFMPFAATGAQGLWAPFKARQAGSCAWRGVPALALLLVLHRMVPQNLHRADWGQALAMHAQAHSEEGALQTAWELQQQALELEPSNPYLLVNAGQLALRRSSPQEASKLCGLARALAPHLANAHACVGVARAQVGDMVTAAENLQEAVKLDAKAVAPRLNLAIVLGRTGRVTEARAILADLARTDPDDPSVRAALQAFAP